MGGGGDDDRSWPGAAGRTSVMSSKKGPSDSTHGRSAQWRQRGKTRSSRWGGGGAVSVQSPVPGVFPGQLQQRSRGWWLASQRWRPEAHKRAAGPRQRLQGTSRPRLLPAPVPPPASFSRGCIPPSPASVFTWPQPPSPQVCGFPKDAIAFRGHQTDNPVIFIPHKVTFTDSGDENMDTFQGPPFDP